MLRGKKTYLLAIAIGAITALHSLKFIDDATYQMLLALLNAGALGTLAAKVNRVEDKVQ